MESQLQNIMPFKAYNLSETASILRFSRGTLANKLSDKKSDIWKFNPTKVDGKWLFLGENLLRGLGSITYSEANSKTNK